MPRKNKLYIVELSVSGSVFVEIAASSETDAQEQVDKITEDLGLDWKVLQQKKFKAINNRVGDANEVLEFEVDSVARFNMGRITRNLFVEIFGFYWSRDQIEKALMLKKYFESEHNTGKRLNRRQVFNLVENI